MSINFYESANYITPGTLALYSLKNAKISYFNVILATLSSINSYMNCVENVLVLYQKIRIYMT